MSERCRISGRRHVRTKIYVDGELLLNEPFVPGRWHDITNHADNSVTRVHSGQHAHFDTTSVKVYVTNANGESNAFSELDLNPFRAMGNAFRGVFGH